MIFFFFITLFLAAAMYTLPEESNQNTAVKHACAVTYVSGDVQ